MIDEFLKRFNLKYEQLTPVERETLNHWMSALQQGAVDVEKIKIYIAAMRAGVENQLCRHEVQDKEDTYLKARLRNYILIEAFLTSPDKAKVELEKALFGIANNLTKKTQI